MNIGIIVHSKTGNTLSVAQKLKEKLLTAGHSVNLDQVEPFNDGEAKAENIRLKTAPDTGAYEALVFAAPVRGASLSPAMAAYLAQSASLQGKKVACFVTEAFPFPWMGGNRAVAQLKTACESRGTEVLATGVVNWMNGKRQQMIDDVVEKLSRLFRSRRCRGWPQQFYETM